MVTCKCLAHAVKDRVREELEELKAYPTLAIVSVGKDPASQAYIKGKIKDCHEVGIIVTHFELPEDCSQKILNKTIKEAHFASAIILQLPLPPHLDTDAALRLISPTKDVDGLVDGSKFTPCTALGVHEWLKENTELSGKNVVVIGRSKLVGMPLMKLLIDSDTTVTLCHSKTKDIYRYTEKADIVITAIGKPGVLKASDCRDDAIIVDVGISKVGNEIRGDVFKDLGADTHQTITPVPGGVGLLTRAYLMQNVLDAHLKYS